MPLNDDFPKAVAFVVGVREDRQTGATERVPIGTAFFVSVPSTIESVTYTYVVTARHVVRCESETWLRINLTTGGWVDEPVSEWFEHHIADVAVALFRGDRLRDIRWVPLTMFSDRPSVRPALGDPVFFIGLLGASALAKRNVPVVRSGTLGASYQDALPMEDCDKTIFYQQSHVIDCRSYQGFSGSPCFVEFRVPPAESQNKTRGDIVLGNVSLMPEIWCFGLISAHWDKLDQGTLETGEKVEFPINSGVAMVTPIERIRDCLMEPEIADQRTALDQLVLKSEERP